MCKNKHMKNSKGKSLQFITILIDSSFGFSPSATSPDEEPWEQDIIVPKTQMVNISTPHLQDRMNALLIPGITDSPEFASCFRITASVDISIVFCYR